MKDKWFNPSMIEKRLNLLQTQDPTSLVNTIFKDPVDDQYMQELVDKGDQLILQNSDEISVLCAHFQEANPGDNVVGVCLSIGFILGYLRARQDEKR